MMNGFVVKREDAYVAKIGPKSVYYDKKGNIWTKESQAARVWQNKWQADREAQRVKGEVMLLKNGRVEAL